MKISSEAKKAIMIGGTCAASYFAVYVSRNMLGAVGPQMTEGGVITEEQQGALSSIYFIIYAIGQLINGKLGDHIKAKIMISVGLIMAGICNLLMAACASSFTAMYIFYGLSGFFLAMIYGPMTKVVAENTQPVYTVRCSLGYTFSSLLGSPLAGVLAALFLWSIAFYMGGFILILMGVVTFLLFTVFEKKGYIKYYNYEKVKEQGSIKELIKHRIIRFTIIAAITGIIRTNVVFWMTTYFSGHLGYAPDRAALVYTVASFIISLSAFISIAMYELLKHNMDLTIFIGFVISAVSFGALLVVKAPVLAVILIVLGVVGDELAATMLWSRYCPSLKDTGMISGATGFLDFVCYVAASAASTLFAGLLEKSGWNVLIALWFAIMVFAAVISIPLKVKRSAE